jgi:hypothetical protein
LLRIPNHHAATAPALAPGPDRYLGYFENRYGEQAVFVCERGNPTATLYLGDLDWQPRAVVAGRASETVLEPTEQLWLQACWRASAPLRPTD